MHRYTVIVDPRVESPLEFTVEGPPPSDEAASASFRGSILERFEKEFPGGIGYVITGPDGRRSNGSTDGGPLPQHGGEGGMHSYVATVTPQGGEGVSFEVQGPASSFVEIQVTFTDIERMIKEQFSTGFPSGVDYVITGPSGRVRKGSIAAS